MAIATNKLSSACGTTLATIRFVRHKLVNFKLAVPSILAAIIGSSIGASVSVLIDEVIMKYILIGILPITAIIVLNKNLFKDGASDEIILNKRTYITALLSAFIIGM